MKHTKLLSTVFSFILLLASLLTMTASIAPSVQAYGVQPYDRSVSGCYNCYQGAFAFANPYHYYANELYRPTYGVGAYYGHYYGKNTLTYSNAYPYNTIYSNRYYGAYRPTYIYSNSYESLRYPYYRYW